MSVWPEIHHGGKRVPGARYAGKKEEEMLDFSVNVTPLGIPENIRKAMEAGLEKAGWYPDYSKERLKRALGEYHRLLPEYVCLGNGASDVIFRMVFAVRPGRALVLAPTFGEYEAALRCVDAKVDHYRIDHEDFHVKADLADQILPDTEMVFLCNPNNPTGLLIAPDVLDCVLKRCQEGDIWLVIDECFLEFLPDGENYSMVSQLKNYPKLVLIKSFTKMFGIAGLRLGYLLCAGEGTADWIDHFGCDWNINCVAEAAGLEALRSQTYVEQVVDYVGQEREWLYRELTAMGFRTIPGRANYLLFQTPEDTDPKLGDWLLKQGIMVRCCDDYHSLDAQYYRIGINDHKSNEILVKALKEWRELL